MKKTEQIEKSMNSTIGSVLKFWNILRRKIF